MKEPKITTISYGFTQNLGNYQSRRLDVSAEVNSHDLNDVDAAFDKLKQWVDEKLQLPTDKPIDDKPF